MPIQSIPIGITTALKANVPYALPAVAVTVYTNDPSFAASNTPDFLNSTVISATVPSAAAFIKNTSTDATVTLKRK